jgi:hypothetical protein
MNLSLIHEMYTVGQVAMAAVIEQEPLLTARSTEVTILEDPEYLQAIENTAGIVWDEGAIALASKYGLNILNVTWEDTGRYKDSSVGPNISDVTIQI